MNDGMSGSLLKMCFDGRSFGRCRVRFILALSIALLTASTPALAATLKLQVGDQGGQPLVDAVATLYPEGADTAPRPAPREHFVDQKAETFVPFVEVVTVGDTVIFRNSDRTRHHVYTFSPLATPPFDFILKPNEVSSPIRLTKPGAVPVGCNIHDFMINYLFVTDARWAAKSDDKGQITLTDVPPGTYTVKLWHPRLRPGAQQPAQPVTVSGDQASASLSMTVMPAPREDDKDHY
jgi:plastocyanin